MRCRSSLPRSEQRSHFQPQFVEWVNARAAGKEAARKPGKRGGEFFLTPTEGKNPSELGAGALKVMHTSFVCENAGFGEEGLCLWLLVMFWL